MKRHVDVKVIGDNDFVLYEMYGKLYTTARGRGCPTCCFKRKGHDCLINVEPRCCFELLGDNHMNKKCFKEYKGGV